MTATLLRLYIVPKKSPRRSEGSLLRRHYVPNVSRPGHGER
jgi:hypothetical protein